MQYLNLQIIDRLVCGLEPDGVEEGAANENYHIIDIHWIHITETPPPPRVAAAHIIYNWQYKRFDWRCFNMTLILYLFRST